jgi:hypothetical protein
MPRRRRLACGLALTLCGLAHRALAAEAPSAAQLCQPKDPGCGSAEGQCFAEGSALERNQEVQLCVGFQSVNGTTVQKSGGKKAVFTTNVDEYATLSIDTLAPIMQGASFDAKRDYQYVWVGARDKRTVGQEFGWRSEDGMTCLTAPPADKLGSKQDCIGWRLHNKPLVTADGYLVSLLEFGLGRG